MTPQEFHIAIKTDLQQFNTDVYEVFREPELDLIINKMIERFVKQRFYFGSNSKGKGFEQNQKRYADLQTLVKRAFILPETKVPELRDQEHTFKLPEDFMLYVGAYLEANQSNDGKQPTTSSPLTKVPALLVEHEMLDYLLRNPFARPSSKQQLLLIEDNRINAIIDKKSLLKRLSLTYICKPSKIDIHLWRTDNSQGVCDLPDHTHTEIVDLTVAYILEILESRRVQSKELDNSKLE